MQLRNQRFSTGFLWRPTLQQDQQTKIFSNSDLQGQPLKAGRTAYGKLWYYTFFLSAQNVYQHLLWQAHFTCFCIFRIYILFRLLKVVFNQILHLLCFYTHRYLTTERQALPHIPSLTTAIVKLMFSDVLFSHLSSARNIAWNGIK